MSKTPFYVGKALGSVSSRIQGITVEIGGDTTKLSAALSKVNKEIRDTQSWLKDVNKLLKPKEKLDTLKLAGQQANDALARGEISQSQYDALQREIVETEKALEELEQQADQSAVALQKIGAAGTELDKLRENAREMGAKTKFSASEAAEAMNYMAMAGWKTGICWTALRGS